ncbi:FabD/lysophospholipase-like protein [Mycena rosella]|uniref:FabD/lysophospholipase-like protein n=1 Tax=Mycena rosella TaxID=1033263 RepID=A0AAD7DS09_MYCRO|nr:FabD/lysophospholipase-like protein [Mycena rosella]
MTHSEDSDGLRILSFDGGGIRGLSSLLILQGIMYRIKVEKGLEAPPLPCEYFDLIGGTSTGGLIALMLGRLRMSVEEAIDKYDRLAQDVFRTTKRLDQDGRFKASRLKAAIKTIVEDHTAPKNADEPMKDPREGDAICRTFVCARSAHNLRANIPVLFRTYDSPHDPAASCTIWEAARATSAAPTFFKRIDIGTGASAEPFIDGGVGRNNPTDILLEEAQLLFPNRRVACVLSIGTGQMKPGSIPRPSLFQRVLPTDVVRAMAAIAIDCETTNQEMLKRFAGTRGVYFRFNVDQGMQTIKLGAWDRLPEVTAHTKQYVKEEGVKQQLAEAVNALKQGVGVLPTAELHTQMDDIR